MPLEPYAITLSEIAQALTAHEAAGGGPLPRSITTASATFRQRFGFDPIRNLQASGIGNWPGGWSTRRWRS